MGNTAAFFYRRDAYDTSGKRLLGRQSAGEGFLRAIVRHGRSDDLYCYAPQRSDFDDFCKFVRPLARPNQKAHWLDERNPTTLGSAGALFRPDTMIADLAFQRRGADPRAYSICGVTHTIASRLPQRSIGDLLTAPVERWDALVCTSDSVRRAVSRILEDYAEYLAQRTGGRPSLEAKLPVIPLGVDTSRMAHGEAAKRARQLMRAQLEIAEDDVVLLFFGRLVFYAKAHPAPMYLAAERAAKRLERKIVLVLAGWFESEKEEAEFKATAAELCPSVRTVFLDGRSEDVRRDVWSASDIFISLSDNIQETFGLAPIEAMSAGLPVIVSDWDGYRESVRNGVDGLCVPTLMPPAGASRDLASLYGVETLSYPDYVANVSMSTAVDVPACEEAIVKLASDAVLRKRLGENGRNRFESVYAWPVVIRAYEELWGELRELRNGGPARFPRRGEAPANPLMPDPFGLYAHYATRSILGTDRIAPGVHVALFRTLPKFVMTRYAGDYRAAPEVAEHLLAELDAGATPTVNEVLSQHPKPSWSSILRTLGYLAKFGVVSIHPGGGRGTE